MSLPITSATRFSARAGDAHKWKSKRNTQIHTQARMRPSPVRRDGNCCILVKPRQRRFVVKSAAQARRGNFPRKKRGWEVPRSTPLTRLRGFVVGRAGFTIFLVSQVVDFQYTRYPKRLQKG